jgi:hypothetical protein
MDIHLYRHHKQYTMKEQHQWDIFQYKLHNRYTKLYLPLAADGERYLQGYGTMSNEEDNLSGKPLCGYQVHRKLPSL